jgi:hypothetical protein
MQISLMMTTRIRTGRLPMKNRYIKSRFSLILALTTGISSCLFHPAYATTLSSLSIYAGEAMAIQGKVISYNKVSENMPSVNSVTKIGSPKDLMDLAANATLDSYTEGRSFVLTQDIDLAGCSFTTIPSFSGVFDGNGHTISGLGYDDEGYVTGLFRYIKRGAVIQNLNAHGTVNAIDDKQITGGICAINEGVISNCTFTGKINGKSITGGIAAINEVPGTIMACTNKAAITGYYYTGGITGKNYGVVAYSVNQGNINSTIEWVEGSDAMKPDDDVFSALLSGKVPEQNDTTSVRTTNGVDTGGIAGYSKGAVYQCRNKAIIGYPHTGYNVGGIAGRQAGFVSFCQNAGAIHGRKDIGGIVGQMEPHLTLSDLETLPDAVDRLHDLVDVSITDMDSSVSTISDDVRLLSAYADNAVVAGDALGTSAENYLNSVSYTANSLKARVNYLTEKMPKMLEYLEKANDHLSDTAESVTKLVKDADVSRRISTSANKSASVNKAREVITNSSNSLIERIEAGQEIVALVAPDAIDAMESISGNTKSIDRNLDKVTDDLGSGVSYTKDVIKHINGMDDPSMPYLGSDFDISREVLKQNLQGMTDTLSVLADHSDSSSEKVSGDLSEVNDQINVIFHILSDELDRIGNFTKGNKQDELITDVSDEEIEKIEEGRVDHATNTGEVTGDINIGGIAGCMSIDTDDPEENAAGSMNGGFTAKYLLRNIILDCNSDSFIQGKKDGVGGVVGYMEQGIVSDSESYGYVRSTEGGYVGGIAGQSESIIKDSYSMAYLSGLHYVGGISGYGTTITGCGAIPSFDDNRDRCGSIAGHINTDRETHSQKLEAVSGNVFVNDEVAGIDNASFAGHAEPVTYEEMMSRSSVPQGFKNVRVTFLVDDNAVKQSSLPYGSPISAADPPDILTYDNKYVRWEYNPIEKVTAPLIIEGNVKMIEKTLLSTSCYPGLDARAGMVSGNFIDTDTLTVSVSSDEMSAVYAVSYESDHDDPVEALRLYAPYTKSVLYGIDKDGKEVLISEKKRGNYLEDPDGIKYDSYVIKNKSLWDRIRYHLHISP